MRIGRPASDQSTIDVCPQNVPHEQRSACVYCRRHRRAVLVAVVTKGGRLIVEDEDIHWVKPSHDAVVVPCRLCPLETCARSLSVRKLPARLRTWRWRDVSLDEVLARPEVAI